MECPITLRVLDELSLPVAFASAPDQPYEFEALCSWLERNTTNPVTGEKANIDQLIPLGDIMQQRRTMAILKLRRWNIMQKQAFMEEIGELKRDLERLDLEIRQTNNTMAKLTGERVRIEFRIDHLNERYINNNTCPACTCM